MIEEQAVVIALDNGSVVLQYHRESACGACASKQSCSSAPLVKNADRQRSEIKLACNLDVEVGDTVILGIEEKALIQCALFLYALPLITMIMSAAIGGYYASTFSIGSETASIIFGIAGLAGALLLTRHNQYFRRFQEHLEPVILTVNNRSAAATETPDNSPALQIGSV